MRLPPHCDQGDPPRQQAVTFAALQYRCPPHISTLPCAGATLRRLVFQQIVLQLLCLSVALAPTSAATTISLPGATPPGRRACFETPPSTGRMLTFICQMDLVRWSGPSQEVCGVLAASLPPRASVLCFPAASFAAYLWPRPARGVPWRAFDFCGAPHKSCSSRASLRAIPSDDNPFRTSALIRPLSAFPEVFAHVRPLSVAPLF